jgi:hypothetical protein
VPVDALDPELIALGRPPARVGPLLSLSIIVLCGYLMISLRADLRFAREGETPRDVTDRTQLVTDEDLRDRFVRAQLVPDRSFAAQIARGETGVGDHRVAPVLGAEDKIWLYVDSNPWTAEIDYQEIYRGRLRRARDLPFFAELGAYLARHEPVPRHVEAEAVRAALAAGAGRVDAPAGDVLPIGAETAVVVTELVRDRVRLAALATDERPDAATWTAALVGAGVIAPGTVPVAETDRLWRFDAAAPSGADAVRAALAAAKLFAVTVEPVVHRARGAWGDLRVDGDGLRLGVGPAVPWADVQSVTVAVPHGLPDDAVVLLTEDRPAAYWYVVPLYALLALFVLLFGWALWRALRSPPAAEAAGS